MPEFAMQIRRGEDTPSFYLDGVNVAPRYYVHTTKSPWSYAQSTVSEEVHAVYVWQGNTHGPIENGRWKRVPYWRRRTRVPNDIWCRATRIYIQTSRENETETESVISLVSGTENVIPTQPQVIPPQMTHNKHQTFTEILSRRAGLLSEQPAIHYSEPFSYTIRYTCIRGTLDEVFVEDFMSAIQQEIQLSPSFFNGRTELWTKFDGETVIGRGATFEFLSLFWEKAYKIFFEECGGYLLPSARPKHWSKFPLLGAIFVLSVMNDVLPEQLHPLMWWLREPYADEVTQMADKYDPEMVRKIPKSYSEWCALNDEIKERFKAQFVIDDNIMEVDYALDASNYTSFVLEIHRNILAPPSRMIVVRKFWEAVSLHGGDTCVLRAIQMFSSSKISLDVVVRALRQATPDEMVFRQLLIVLAQLDRKDLVRFVRLVTAKNILLGSDTIFVCSTASAVRVATCSKTIYLRPAYSSYKELATDLHLMMDHGMDEMGE